MNTNQADELKRCVDAMTFDQLRLLWRWLTLEMARRIRCGLYGLAFLLSCLCCHAADTYSYHISWTNSVTAGASNRIFVSQHPFLGRPVTNAMHKFDVGFTNRVPATLSAGVWRFGLVSVLDGVESDLAAIAIEVPTLKPVPETPTMLKGEVKP